MLSKTHCIKPPYCLTALTSGFFEKFNNSPSSLSNFTDYLGATDGGLEGRTFHQALHIICHGGIVIKIQLEHNRHIGQN